MCVYIYIYIEGFMAIERDGVLRLKFRNSQKNIYIYTLYVSIHISIIYQNGKEIKPSYQVLRVSCKRVLQSSTSK